MDAVFDSINLAALVADARSFLMAAIVLSLIVTAAYMIYRLIFSGGSSDE